MSTGIIVTVAFFGVAVMCILVALAWVYMAAYVHRRQGQGGEHVVRVRTRSLRRHHRRRSDS